MSGLARRDVAGSAPLLWRIAFRPVHRVVTALVPIRVEGRDLLPRDGPYIVAADHISWLDPPIIEFALEIPIRYMGKREVFAVPVLGGVLRALGNFPVRRGESDRRALEAALAVLRDGGPLGYFPEGTRSRDGRLRRAKPGVGFLARRSGAPIVPVAITGTSTMRALPPWQEIHVRVGRPFSLADLGASGGDDQAAADAIMRRVAEMLPAAMRGAYAE